MQASKEDKALRPSTRPVFIAVLATASACFLGIVGCASSPDSGVSAEGGAAPAGGSGSAIAGASSAGASSAGTSGAPASLGGAGQAMQAGAAGAVVASGGAPSSGGNAATNQAGAPSGGGSAGSSAVGGSSGRGGTAGMSNGGSGNAASGAAGAPNNCNLPATVGFQKDIQPFLTSSCGKGVSSGCHVTDSNKTSLGYTHAYDWITAVAHTGSCGKTPPYAKRFEVVLAVINAANPPSCPNSRKMPPPGMGVPLTVCQIAALRAWLEEPMVSQMHVPVSDDTTALYPPGPYLMPPFN